MSSTSPTRSASAPQSPDASIANAHVVSLRLLFTAWLTHFRSLGYIKESTMELLDKTVCRRTLELTVRDAKAREAIGTSERVWSDLVDLLRVALPSLEGRIYAPPAATNTATNYALGTSDAGAAYDGAPGPTPVPAPAPVAPNVYDTTSSGPSSNIMVANSVTLLRDLQRLDSVLALGRNVLTAGEKCQNLAAQVGFDREVCAVVNLCVKVTARGFDGDGSGVEEERWNAVVNGFKKLLITSLQFLSNLVTMNERLKLMLWVELFDSSSENGAVAGLADSIPGDRNIADKWISNATNVFVNQQQPTKNTSTSRETSPEPKPNTEMWPLKTPHKQVATLQKPGENDERARTQGARPMRPVTPYFLFLQQNREKIKADLSLEGEPSTKELVQEGTRRWNELQDDERKEWRQQYSENFEKYKKNLEAWKAAVPPEASKENGVQAPSVSDSSDKHGTAMNNEPVVELLRRPSGSAKQAAFQANADLLSPLAYSHQDYQMMETAADGAKKLAEGKSQLLKRLEHATLHQMQPPPLVSLASPLETPMSPIDGAERDLLVDEEEEDEEDDEDESEEDESSDEDDYAVPGEDGRGLLTDVPLILGPNEIEVLPMIIMSGIVAPTAESNPNKKDNSYLTDGVINMYTIRCHLLLAQENGRNLLRELLIFVAAWDLREEELYFKFMVKIMEAILMNGLMPFAYNAFKESKDIISPAQAVIMKLLTKIFHARQAFIGGPNVLNTPPRQDPAQPTPSAPLRFDIQIVHFLFSEFRQNIIPQICALIFLQGQIRLGYANLEDFPLNLWDMERMYEGVYQYLEFFAILTDHESWKQLMAEWEVTYELVTLLRELEVAIPKGRLVTNLPPPLAPLDRRPSSLPARLPSPSPPSSAHSGTVPQIPVPVAVERPYDVNSPPLLNTQLPNDPGTPADATPSPYPEQIHDEPADFEWRNLKKLCVLVLSSLVWKNRQLQDQVRDFGGITAILSCCAFDEHNPYIREHAIMCLRFLLENNQENQNIVKGFAEADAQGTGEQGAVRVPMEVLDSRGYETYMDGKGKVGLRRKEAPREAASQGRATGKVGLGEENGDGQVKDAWNKTPTLGALPEWMQMAMKNLPSTSR